MKILFVLPSLNLCGGIESFAMNYYRRIRNTVSCDFITHELKDDELKNEIEANGDKVYVLPPFGGGNLTKVLRSIRDFFLTHDDYDIIHCNMANAAPFYFASSKAPVKLLHSHQDKYADRVSHAIRNIPLIKLGILMATDYAACTKKAGDFLFGKKSYHIIQNAIELNDYVFSENERIRIRQELSLTDNDILIGCIGRLTEQKNHKKLLRIMEFLPDKYHLILLGDGHLEDSLRRQAKSLGIENRVIFAGSVENVSSYLSAMDATVLPSLYEGLGIVNIESQVSGLPTIVSDKIPDDADLGELFEKVPLDASPKEWAYRIRHAIGEARLTSRSDEALVRAARDHGFDIGREAGKLVRYYKGLILPSH